MPHPVRGPSWLPALCVMAVIALSGPLSLTTYASITGFLEDPQTTGFDARLWQQLYLAESPDQPQHRTDATSALAGDVAHQITTNGGQRPRSQFIPDRMIEVSLAALMMEAIQAETGADGAETDRVARRLPQLLAAADNPLAAPPGHGNGPSPTTMLVGLVAAIVVCGALCTGKD